MRLGYSYRKTGFSPGDGKDEPEDDARCGCGDRSRQGHGRENPGKIGPLGLGKIRLIPNWSDEDAIRPSRKPKTHSYRRSVCRHRRSSSNISGNMGLSHGMETIVGAASRLQDIPVRFLFIGGGGKREKIGKMVADLGLEKLSCSRRISRRRVSDIHLPARTSPWSALKRGWRDCPSPASITESLRAEDPSSH